MADIRIKDLATLESASLTGDVFVIDGTTGTRKLSAFSPSFGGNATVTGTLTVSGATMSVGGGSGSIVSALDGTAGNYKLHLFRSGGVDRWYCGLQAATETGSNAGAPFGITALSDAGAQIDVPLQITRAAGGAVTIVRPTAITNTTASTTTSSGALVVSGGVGVAGNINGGGAILAQGALSSIPAVNYLSTELSSGQGYITCYNGSGSAYLALNYRASQHNFTSNGAVAVQSTTASTTTSTGALVVGNGTSGGLGVGGSINTGGTLRFHTNANLPGVGSMGISATYGLNMYASTGSSYDFTVFNAAGSSLILNPTGTQNVTFPGVVAIGNTVTTGASVASTHKVQISIGGTTYYLLASNV